MGIYEFSRIRSSYITSSTLHVLNQRTNNTPANVYIDGSFFVFSGCIGENIKNGQYDEDLVAFVAFKTILKQLCLIRKQKIIINKCILYFDGHKPAIKNYTTNKRRSVKNMPKMNITKVINRLTRYINNVKTIEIKHLIIGESEHEAFVRRDVNYPTIILTNDSDAVHIAYGYEQETFNDFVFICTKNLLHIYDMYMIQKKFRLPKYAFSLLLMLKGSDFTNQIFTNTMSIAILNAFCYEHQNNSDVQKFVNYVRSINKEYIINYNNKRVLNKLQKSLVRNYDSSKDIKLIEYIYPKELIYKTIRAFLGIILFQTNSHVTWNRSNYLKSKCISKTNNEIDSLFWSINYSAIGCFFDQYDNEAYTFVEKLSPYSFYHYILTFKFNDIIEFGSLSESENISLYGNELMDNKTFKANRLIYIKHLTHDEM